MNNQPSERFTIETVSPGFYYVTDHKTFVSVSFHEGRFHETKEWYFPADPELQKPIRMQRIKDTIESWLTWHKPELLGTDDRYTLQFSEDKKNITFTRLGTPGKPGDPKIVITFPAETYKKTIAALIRNAARYLKDSAPDWHTVNFQ